ncbi:unnamed protein product [Rhodiola kirilowii]
MSLHMHISCSLVTFAASSSSRRLSCSLVTFHASSAGRRQKKKSSTGNKQSNGAKRKDDVVAGFGAKKKAEEKWTCVQNCGACCKLDKGPGFGTPEEIFDDPVDIQLFKSMVGSDGWCIHYEQTTRSCSIYEDRPYFCRVEEEVFLNLYGIDKKRFNKEACGSCRDTIKEIYGSNSSEMENFNAVIQIVEDGADGLRLRRVPKNSSKQSPHDRAEGRRGLSLSLSTRELAAITTMPSSLLQTLILIISFSTLLLLHVDGELVIQRRRLQAVTPANRGAGRGNAAASLPKQQTQGGATRGVPNGVAIKGNKRKKGGHGKMKAEFLNAHNEVRAKYGEPLLKWNHTLERYAQQWASMRATDCKLVHAPNNQYGENLFWGKYRHWKPREVVKQWADEVAFYNSKNYHCAEGQQCGHYTQIVWRSSAWLGCAKQICLNGEIFVVCEYFPAGNYLDTPDPFTATTSYPGEENNIPKSSGPNMTTVATPSTKSSSSLQSTTTKGSSGQTPTRQN